MSRPEQPAPVLAVALHWVLPCIVACSDGTRPQKESSMRLADPVEILMQGNRR